MKPLLASPLALVIAVLTAAAVGLVGPLLLGMLFDLVPTPRYNDDLLTTVMIGFLVLAPGGALMILTANDIKLATTPRRPPSDRDDDLFTLAFEMSFQYQAARTLFMATPLLFLWAVGLSLLARFALPLAEIDGWRASDQEIISTIAIHAGLWVAYPVLFRGGALMVMGTALSRLGGAAPLLFDSAKKTLFYFIGVAVYLAGLLAAIQLMPKSGGYKGVAGWFYITLAVYSLVFVGLTILVLRWWSQRR